MLLKTFAVIVLNICTVVVCKAQSKSLQAKVLGFLFEEGKRDDVLSLLSNKTTNSLFNSNSPYRNSEILDIFSSDILDSLEAVCRIKAEYFEWDCDSENFIVLSNDGFNRHFDFTTQPAVEYTHKSSGKTKVGKKNTYAFIYIRTSPIVQIGNYLLIHVSASSGLTKGSSCLYVFAIDNVGNLNIVKKVNCSIS